MEAARLGLAPKDQGCDRESGGRLPEIGRFNAGQKLLSITIVVSLIALLISRIEIWRFYFGEYFSIHTIRQAALVHALFAFVLICGTIAYAAA